MVGFGLYAVERSDQGRAEDHGQEGEESEDIEHGMHLVRGSGIRQARLLERERLVMVARMGMKRGEKGC